MYKVGILGCGYWGPNLIRNFYQLSGIKVACCDLKKERIDKVKKLFPNIETFSDYDKMLGSGVDAVAIATPVGSHYALAKKALMAGKHVLVEKPLTETSNHARELIELSEKKKKVLMVDHTFEYSPPVRKLKEIVKSGELGDIYTINSTRVNLGLFQKDINVLLDLAPHDISIMNYLLEDEPVAVRAVATHFISPKIQDTAYLLVRYRNNVVAHLHVSWLSPRKVRDFTIIGSKKMVYYDDTSPDEKIKTYDKGISVDELPPVKSYAGFADFHFSYRSGDIHMPKVENVEPLREVCSHFIDCIKTGKKPLTDGYSALRVVKVLEGAQKSLQENGAEVSI